MLDDLAVQLANDTQYSIGNALFKSYLPDSPDNCIAIIETGGLEPDKELPTKEPTFQVIIRGTSYNSARSKMLQVRSSLHQRKNEFIGSTFFFFILLTAEGGHIGRDDLGRDEFSLNFRARTR